MKNTVTVLLLAAFIFSLSGCAALFNGSRSTVRINSDPGSADVFINGQFYGKTPLRLELKNNGNYLIEFRKAGFRSVTRQIDNRIGAGWLIIDVLLGLVPVIVDAATGSWCELDQTHVNVALVQQQPK